MAIVKAYIVPHPPLIVHEVGNGKERQIEKTIEAYTNVAQEIAQIKPETIIISSPHATMFKDFFNISDGKSAQGSFSQFGAPQVHFREVYDEELVSIIKNLAESESFPAGTASNEKSDLDHGTMVPLYFIRKFFSNFKIVRIGLSALPLERHYHFGQIIKLAVEKTKRRAVYVASGDLSHKLQSYGPYGFAEEGPQYDERIMSVCSRAAFDELFDFSESFCERASECGHRSFVIMAGALDGIKVDAKKFSHEDVTGVGYLICSFEPTGVDNSRKFLERRKIIEGSKTNNLKNTGDACVNLAKRSIESYVNFKKTIDIPEGLPQELINSCAGAFVSIHKQGKLRGCIGTILPTKDNLAEEIIHNAVSASSRDSRFEPILPEELSELEVNVDVLSTPENVNSVNDLDAKRYGVIVTRGERRGVLLPNLDGIDTVEQQISIAKKKAGIDPDEEVSLQRFEVVRHT